jgi:REP element-mobilizing transposase RayT
MPAYARREIVNDADVGVYHCTSRCVRRAFLCGEDPVAGRCFEHRKGWLRNRLEALAGAFAIDVLGFAVMSNHLHVILRNRPDVAAEFSDEEVARRWRRVFSKRYEADGTPTEDDESEFCILLADREGLAERRRRLASISWFMRALCEPIARRANREDRATGRFWEGRFKCQAVLDESALLACSIYVDLNPIRAGIAATPETSWFTAAFERIRARQEAAARESDPAHSSQRMSLPSSPPRSDDWLSPIADSDAGPAAERPISARRASNRGFLPLTLDHYLALLDWTGRQLRYDKRGAIPIELRPILERLSINVEAWVENMRDFGRRFPRVIGRTANMAAFAQQRNRHWFQGQTASRHAFT